MTKTEDDLTVATPEQIADAWERGVMRGDGRRVRENLRDHPPTIEDPTYYRRMEGWSSARDILSPSAIVGMRGYLASKGLCAPDAVEAAWEINTQRDKCRTEVGDIVASATRDLRDNTPRWSTLDRNRFIDAALAALTEARD